MKVRRETPLPDNPHYWARKGGVSVRLCRGDGVSAGNVMGGCSQVRALLVWVLGSACAWAMYVRIAEPTWQCDK